VVSDVSRIEGEVIEPPRCVFLEANVVGMRTIYRCAATGAHEVLVPVKAAGGMFLGEGVRGVFCVTHAKKLVDEYGGRLP
jgi:hypothetical protein